MAPSNIFAAETLRKVTLNRLITNQWLGITVQSLVIIGDSFSGHLNLFHSKEQQIYFSNINLDIEFTFLARFCKWKKSIIFLFFTAPLSPNIIPKPFPVSLYLLCFVNRVVLQTLHKQVNSGAAIARQLIPGTASDRCTICWVSLLLQVQPHTKRCNARLTRRLQATEPWLLSASHACS